MVSYSEKWQSQYSSKCGGATRSISREAKSKDSIFFSFLRIMGSNLHVLIMGNIGKRGLYKEKPVGALPSPHSVAHGVEQCPWE